MKRSIRDSVVVITGAGSGIGRATAETFAERGATLVLAGRSRETLARTRDACRNLGAECEIQVADTRDQHDVNAVARLGVRKFGRIDIWVNNAGVAAYGMFEDVPREVFEGVVRTNLFGYANGIRAVVPMMKQQGRGIIINNLSIVGKIGVARFSSYAVSKAALFMLDECLRQELIGTDIHVCSIVTPSVNTGVYQRSANYTGRAVRPFPPVYDPYTLAKAVVRAAENPRGEINVGAMNWLMMFGHTFTPWLFEKVAPLLMEIGAFQKGRSATPSEGNVLKPSSEFTGVRGGWTSMGTPSAHMEAERHASNRTAPVLGAVALTGISAAALLLLRGGTLDKKAA